MPQKRVEFVPTNSSHVQEKFINCLMRGGKKSISRKIFANTLKKISEKKQDERDAIEIFEVAIGNVKPNIEVRAKRVGGSVYQVPREVPPKRQLTLAIRWIIGACRKKSGKPMSERLAEEISQAANMEGDAFRKREDVHRMAQANKAFAYMARY